MGQFGPMSTATFGGVNRAPSHTPTSVWAKPANTMGSPAPTTGSPSFDHPMHDAEVLAGFEKPWDEGLGPDLQAQYVGAPNAPAPYAANPGIGGWRNWDLGGQTIHQHMGNLGALAQPVVDAFQPLADVASGGLGLVNDGFEAFAGSDLGRMLGNAGQGVTNYSAGRPFNVNALQSGGGMDMSALLSQLTPAQLAELTAMLGG